MPTYDYVCRACKHKFELFQSMSASIKRKCPKCGKSSLERLMGTGAGIIFKGSGFYETDYRSESYKKGAESESKSSSSDSKPDSKSDSKTDTKNDPRSSSKSPDSAPASKDSAPKPSTSSDSKPAAKPDTPSKSPRNNR